MTMEHLSLDLHIRDFANFDYLLTEELCELRQKF
jgi:hypothetical protein